MELDDLSPSEERIAQRLTTLVAPLSAETRSRLLAAMHAAPGGAPAAHRSWRWGGRLRLAALGVSAVAVLLGVGIGALGLSAHALPGSPTYSLRVAGEHLRLWTAGPADRERLRVEFARERLEEAHSAPHSDRAVLETLLRDGHSYLQDAARDLSQGEIDTGTRNDVQQQIGNLHEQENQIGSQLGVEAPSGQPESPAGGQGPEGTPEPNQTGSSGGAGASSGGAGRSDAGPGSANSDAGQPGGGQGGAPEQAAPAGDPQP